MLSREYRLRSKFDFKKVYNQGIKVVNPYLVLYLLEKTSVSPECVRIGFSVSKKLGNAVKRNKIKRRMREAVKPYLSLISKKVDLIFIARKKISDINFKEIEKNMNQLFKRAKLI